MSNGLHDYWLKGTDQQEVESCLAAAGIPTRPSINSSYDPIGTILDAQEQLLPGFHANLRLRYEMTPEQQEAMASVLIPEPANPARVWG